jgi:acyl transferase domain-containing protein
MVAVRANTDTLADVLAGSGVAIAGRNAPMQAIIGGPRAAIEAVLPRLDAAGMSYQVLPMSAGFHIPDARPAADRFAEILGEIRFAAPEIPIYSNSTAGEYPSENGGIGRMLIEHLTQPVRFQDQIEAMYAH